MFLNRLITLLVLAVPFVMSAAQISKGRCFIQSENRENITFCYSDGRDISQPLLILECGEIKSIGQPSVCCTIKSRHKQRENYWMMTNFAKSLKPNFPERSLYYGKTFKSSPKGVSDPSVQGQSLNWTEGVLSGEQPHGTIHEEMDEAV